MARMSTHFPVAMTAPIRDRLRSSCSCFRWQRSDILVFAVGLLAAALIGLAYWIVCVLMRPDEPRSIRIMYRYGDTDYLPLIYALARFNVHEFATLGNSGLLPFPLLFFLPHAAMIALFGDWGFAAADALIMATWFILFFLLAKGFTEDPRAAALIGLVMLVAAGPWGWTGVMPAGWGEGPNNVGYSFDVWGFRYTRPFVAGLFMLALVLTTRTVVASLLAGRARPAVYAIHGLLLSGSAQGDMHLAIIGCCATAALYLFFLITRPSDPSSLKALLVTAVSFALGVAPMAVQQVIAGNAEYTARMGMFPVDRSRPPLYFDIGDAVGLTSLLGLWSVIWMLARRYAARRLHEINLLLGVVFLHVVFSIIAMPLSASLIGRAFLLYQFHDRRMKFSALGYTLILGLLVVLGYRAWQHARRETRGRSPTTVELAFAAALVGVAMAGIRSSAIMAADRAATTVQPRVWNSTWQTGWPPLSKYRSDLAKLLVELGRPQYDGERVLATFDQQFAMWWLAFRKGYLFIPDPFLSSAADVIIETRTLQLLKLAGASSEFLDSKLDETYFDMQFFGHDKWQASDAYIYGKLDDYTPAQLEQIGWTTILDSWTVLVPRSERERLAADFAHIAEADRLPDLIILPNGAGYDNLRGPGVPFRLAYENTTFRVWSRPLRQE
jgi:hypothetical protein